MTKPVPTPAGEAAPGGTPPPGLLRHQKIGLAVGLIGAILIQLLPVPDGLSRDAWIVVSLAVLMASWWVTEAIPIPVTSLLPLVVLPMAGVSGFRAVAAPYASPIVLLLLGGFIIAKSVERWHLHERIALNIVARAGSHPAALVGGFMVAAALLSMWISNTATSIMLMPIAMSVAVAVLGKRAEGAGFTIALLIGIAYAASIGGLGTPIGTPTNLIVIGYLKENFGRTIGFAQWMMIGIPVVLVMIPAAWFVLTRWAYKMKASDADEGQEVVREHLAALGRITSPEKRVLIAFGVIAFLWMFRLPLNELSIFGITPFINLTDPIIAVAGAIAMFLIPSGSEKEKGSMLLDWDMAVQVPWGVVLLFGGGLSLAAAITSSGLAAWLGDNLSGLTALPPIAIMFVLVAFVIFATELTSNVATTTALMPVVGAIASAGGADPVLLAAPVAMAASCAFMLPMATGPNAIVFATGHVTIPQMVRAGIRLNLLGMLLITALVSVLVPLVL